MALLTEGGFAPVKSINMALLTEVELALSWIDSERQNNNTIASPTPLILTTWRLVASSSLTGLRLQLPSGAQHCEPGFDSASFLILTDI